jgi:hypothetical protein
MLPLILEPTQATTLLSSCMDSTHEHLKHFLDELKISKTPQAADKAKKVGQCHRITDMSSQALHNFSIVLSADFLALSWPFEPLSYPSL